VTVSATWVLVVCHPAIASISASYLANSSLTISDKSFFLGLYQILPSSGVAFLAIGERLLLLVIRLPSLLSRSTRRGTQTPYPFRQPE
jgi:hypothetical protein